MAHVTTNQRRVLALFARFGPGHSPARYEQAIGLNRNELHAAVEALNRVGLLDTDLEMGSLWIGNIE